MKTSTPTQMAREVAEQPAAARATLDALLPLREEVRALAAGRRRVLFAARGSSDNAAIYGRYLLETHAGVLGGLVVPQRRHPLPQQAGPVGRCGRERLPVRRDRGDRGHAGVGAGVRRGDDRGRQRRRLRRSSAAADLALVTQAGPELAVPATKTYLTQLVAMATLGTALAPDPSALDAELERVPDEVARVLADPAGVDAGGRHAAGRVVRRRLGPRADARHRARDRAQAGGDLPAPGARLLVRRPAARPDLGRDVGDDRGARGGRRTVRCSSR